MATLKKKVPRKEVDTQELPLIARPAEKVTTPATRYRPANGIAFTIVDGKRVRLK